MHVPINKNPPQFWMWFRKSYYKHQFLLQWKEVRHKRTADSKQRATEQCDSHLKTGGGMQESIVEELNEKRRNGEEVDLKEWQKTKNLSLLWKGLPVKLGCLAKTNITRRSEHLFQQGSRGKMQGHLKAYHSFPFVLQNNLFQVGFDLF